MRLPSSLRSAAGRLAVVALCGAVLAAAGPAKAQSPGVTDVADAAFSVSHSEPFVAPTGYVAVTPTRLADTRDGLGVRRGTLPAGGTLTVVVAGGDVPPGATAAVLNVTAVLPTAPSYLTVWPAGQARPTASNLNLVRGATTANSVVVGLGVGGAVQIFNDTGQVDVVVDVAGYLAPGAGDALVPTTPVRILDSRDGTGSPAQRWSPGETRRIPLPGWVPAGVTGVVLNLTAVDPSAPTYLTAWPGGARPNTSNVNLDRGATVPNLVVTGVTDRAFSIFNSDGLVHVVADVAGYLLPGAAGSFLAQQPTRVADSRIGMGVARARLEAGQTMTLTVAGADAGAVALNVTAVSSTATSFLTVWPAGGPRPLASSLNMAPGGTVPNALVVATTGGRITLYNAVGSVDVIVDVLAVWAGAVASTVSPLVLAPPPPAPPAPVVTPPAPTGAGSASAYVLNRYSDGTVFRWNPCAPIDYRVNTTYAPAGALADVQATMAAITAAGGVSFRYLGQTAGLPQRAWQNTWPAGEAPLVIAWGRPLGQAGASDFLTGGGVVGQGGWTARGGSGSALQIVNGFVILDATWTNLGQGFGTGGQGQVLLHEVGHAMGLGHAPEAAQMMFASVTGKAGGYGAGDVAGLQAVGLPAGCL